MLFHLFLIVIFTFILHYAIRMMDFIKKASTFSFPGFAYPIIGHAYLFIRNPEKAMSRISKISETFGIWFGPFFNVMIYNPKDVEKILKSSKKLKKAYQYNLLRPWLGDSILLSSGEKFRQNKKILMQAFHIRNLKTYISIFNRHAESMVQDFRKLACNGQEFDVYGVLTRHTLSTLLETTLGIDCDTMDYDHVQTYAKALDEIQDTIHKRMFKFWLYPDIFFKFSNLKRRQDKSIAVINYWTDRIIEKRRLVYEENQSNQIQSEKGSNHFLDHFFKKKDDGSYFTRGEIRDEIATIMFAGQDTTTATISFVLSLLGEHKNVQSNVIEELDNIFGNSNRELAYEDLYQMKYLEQVIQETWRLFPPIPVIARNTTEEIELDNHIIPKNCTVAVLIVRLHRNQNCFNNPDEFNPDNFLPEKIKERHPYSFIPFSVNYRQCIGNRYAMMVIKILLSTILRNFKVTNKRSTKQFRLTMHTVLKSKDGHPLILEERQNSSRAIII